MAAGRSIGVAVDFSACSKNALRRAAASLACSGDRLMLIHVKSSYQYQHVKSSCRVLVSFVPVPLILLVEFSDPRVSKIYGVAPDRETLEILTRAANQKGVKCSPRCTGLLGRRYEEPRDVVNHATCPVTVVRENVLPPAATAASY